MATYIGGGPGSSVSASSLLDDVITATRAENMFEVKADWVGADKKRWLMIYRVDARDRTHPRMDEISTTGKNPPLLTILPGDGWYYQKSKAVGPKFQRFAARSADEETKVLLDKVDPLAMAPELLKEPNSVAEYGGTRAVGGQALHEFTVPFSVGDPAQAVLLLDDRMRLRREVTQGPDGKEDVVEWSDYGIDPQIEAPRDEEVQ